MKCLFSSPSPPEVELLKGLLDEAGIATELRNESIYPNLPGAAFQPEIWVVDEKDYERACELRDAWHQPIPGAEVETREPDTSGLTFVGLVLLAGCAVLAWLSARASNWVIFVVALAFLGSLGVLCLVVARQHGPGKRTGRRTGS
jgi:Putative prokaryotic signal transducing protein